MKLSLLYVFVGRDTPTGPLSSTFDVPEIGDATCVGYLFTIQRLRKSQRHLSFNSHDVQRNFLIDFPNLAKDWRTLQCITEYSRCDEWLLQYALFVRGLGWSLGFVTQISSQ